MSRLFASAFVAAVLVLSASSANASDDSKKPVQNRAVQGVLATEEGGQVNFTIPQGGGITFKKKDDATTYRLVAEDLKQDRATLSVVDSAASEVLETFDLGLDGKLRNGAFVPISLSVSGITSKTAQRCASKSASIGGLGLIQEKASCCITNCGGFERVCCEPSAGWCCTLECVASSNPSSDLAKEIGDSCTACTSSPK